MKWIVVLISLACNYNSGFSSCHLSLEGFIDYVYLAADTRKMFFEDLAFYGALYLLANKSTYSVSQKEALCSNSLFQLQTAMERLHFFSATHLLTIS